MKENAIIVGAGTYGQVYAEYLKDLYNIIGFVDDDSTTHHQVINNVEVLGDVNYLVEYISKDTAVFVPIGNNSIRQRIIQRLMDAGFKTPKFIHPDCKIHPSVKIGKCCYILPGTYIMPLTVLGDFVMISMGVNIAHHTIIENGCFFSQGSNIGASIHFGKHVFCGIASTVMTGVKTVGNNALVGAGAVVIRDVPDRATVVGNPAKILKIAEE